MGGEAGVDALDTSHSHNSVRIRREKVPSVGKHQRLDSSVYLVAVRTATDIAHVGKAG
jgi:hypothetical protein